MVKICVLLNNGWFPVNPVKTDSNKETVVDATETGFLPGLDWTEVEEREAYKYPLVMVEHRLITVYCVVSDVKITVIINTKTS